MKDFYQFANMHPLFAFGLAYLVFRLAVSPLNLVNRYIRSRNIRNAGWPPNYLDADGDSVKESK